MIPTIIIGALLLITLATAVSVPSLSKKARQAEAQALESTRYAEEAKAVEAANLAFGTKLVAAGALIAAVVVAGFSSVYTQSVGQASVLVDAGGQVAGQNDAPGWALKAPWQKRIEWDLFSRSITYAGTSDEAPSYTNGEVNGQQVTAAVARGAQANFDISVVYNLDGAKVSELYEKYRTQETFTKQVIEARTLAVVRGVPSEYTPVEFRGDKRGDAQTAMQDRLDRELKPFGVDVSMVNLQNITYSDDVESSLKGVEVAQQKEAEAQANLRATEVSAQAQVVEAEAQAEANRILSGSLDEKVLRKQWIDAVRETDNLVVVPEGSTPMIQTPGGAK